MHWGGIPWTLRRVSCPKGLSFEMPCGEDERGSGKNAPLLKKSENRWGTQNIHDKIGSSWFQMNYGQKKELADSRPAPYFKLTRLMACWWTQASSLMLPMFRVAGLWFCPFFAALWPAPKLGSVPQYHHHPMQEITAADSLFLQSQICSIRFALKLHMLNWWTLILNSQIFMRASEHILLQQPD